MTGQTEFASDYKNIKKLKIVKVCEIWLDPDKNSSNFDSNWPKKDPEYKTGQKAGSYVV